MPHTHKRRPEIHIIRRATCRRCTIHPRSTEGRSTPPRWLRVVNCTSKSGGPRQMNVPHRHVVYHLAFTYPIPTPPAASGDYPVRGHSEVRNKGPSRRFAIWATATNEGVKTNAHSCHNASAPAALRVTATIGDIASRKRDARKERHVIRGFGHAGFEIRKCLPKLAQGQSHAVRTTTARAPVHSHETSDFVAVSATHWKNICNTVHD